VEQKNNLQKIIKENIPKDEVKIMRTIADYYMERGENRGVAIGEARGIAKGEALGMEKKAVVIAKNLLKAGISLDVIAKSTGLSTSEIQKIKP